MLYPPADYCVLSPASIRRRLLQQNRLELSDELTEIKLHCDFSIGNAINFQDYFETYAEYTKAAKESTELQ